MEKMFYDYNIVKIDICKCRYPVLQYKYKLLGKSYCGVKKYMYLNVLTSNMIERKSKQKMVL